MFELCATSCKVFGRARKMAEADGLELRGRVSTWQCRFTHVSRVVFPHSRTMPFLVRFDGVQPHCKDMTTI